MSKVKSFRSFALTLGVLGIGTIVTSAQPPEKRNPSVDPSGNARTVKVELKESYKKWLSNDVKYIITKEEERAFKALTTDEERENFIENFWRRRDPNPDTEENEYREEYYQRIAYANEHYTSGIPGWKTDRGRIYIMFGTQVHGFAGLIMKGEIGDDTQGTNGSGDGDYVTRRRLRRQRAGLETGAAIQTNPAVERALLAPLQ
jgi:GWxTD domain-containing protein